MSNHQPPSFTVVTKSTSSKRYSENDRLHHLEEWKKSGVSMNQYCQDKDLTISTLSKWVRSANQTKTQFKPVKIASASIHNQNGSIEIIIDNRIKIKLSNASDVSIVVDIVRNLIQCN